MVVRCAAVLCLHLALLNLAWGMEPLALLATQPVWQAAQPITVNVDYDGKLQNCALRLVVAYSYLCSVPAFGTIDEVMELQQASKVEYSCEAVRNACINFSLAGIGASSLQGEAVGQMYVCEI